MRKSRLQAPTGRDLQITGDYDVLDVHRYERSRGLLFNGLSAYEYIV